MLCDFETIAGTNRVRCSRCGGVALAHRLPTGECAASNSPAQSAKPRECNAGCILTRLLAQVGFAHESDCNCSSEAAKMDAGTTTVEETVEVMRAEAARRGVRFAESQARWLIELAIKLAKEKRDPNRLERVRLRAIRIANRIVNGQS